MSAAIAAAGRRVLDLIDVLLDGEDPGPLAELAVLRGLTHVTVRDAVIAQLLGYDDVAQALVHEQPVSMAWLHQTPARARLTRALRVVDHLSPQADRDVDTRDALCSIRALLLWLSRRPLEAHLTIAGISHDYPLATAIATMLASGYEPLPHDPTAGRS